MINSSRCRSAPVVTVDEWMETLAPVAVVVMLPAVSTSSAVAVPPVTVTDFVPEAVLPPMVAVIVTVAVPAASLPKIWTPYVDPFWVEMVHEASEPASLFVSESVSHAVPLESMTPRFVLTVIVPVPVKAAPLWLRNWNVNAVVVAPEDGTVTAAVEMLTEVSTEAAVVVTTIVEAVPPAGVTVMLAVPEAGSCSCTWMALVPIMSQLPMASPQNNVEPLLDVNVPAVVWNVADVRPAGIAAVTVVNVPPTSEAVAVPPPAVKFAAVGVNVATSATASCAPSPTDARAMSPAAVRAVSGFTLTPAIVIVGVPAFATVTVKVTVFAAMTTLLSAAPNFSAPADATAVGVAVVSKSQPAGAVKISVLPTTSRLLAAIAAVTMLAPSAVPVLLPVATLVANETDTSPVVKAWAVRTGEATRRATAKTAAKATDEPYHANFLI